MSIEYALVEDSEYKYINKDECSNIFNKKGEQKPLLYFIVNKNDQKVLVENSNIESLQNYKKLVSEVSKENKNFIKKIPDNSNKRYYELGCGEFEKIFKISNSIVRDVDGKLEKFNPDDLDKSLENYKSGIEKLMKQNKKKIDEFKSDFLYNISQVTKKSSFAFNQYFEKKLDNEMRKNEIFLTFKNDNYNNTEEVCSFCNNSSKNILYDHFDKNYKLCKNCEAALSSFYPHNFVTKK